MDTGINILSRFVEIMLEAREQSWRKLVSSIEARQKEIKDGLTEIEQDIAVAEGEARKLFRKSQEDYRLYRLFERYRPNPIPKLRKRFKKKYEEILIDELVNRLRRIHNGRWTYESFREEILATPKLIRAFGGLQKEMWKLIKREYRDRERRKYISFDTIESKSKGKLPSDMVKKKPYEIHVHESPDVEYEIKIKRLIGCFDESLSPQLRKVFNYLEESRKPKEIAEYMGISVFTVYDYIEEIRKKAKKHFETLES